MWHVGWTLVDLLTLYCNVGVLPGRETRTLSALLLVSIVCFLFLIEDPSGSEGNLFPVETDRGIGPLHGIPRERP